MKSSTRNTPLAVIACLIGLTAPIAHAQQLTWSSGASVANEHFLTNGTPMATGFTFTLGYFAAGFNPASQPFSLWNANFTSIESTIFNQSPFNTFFSTTATIAGAPPAMRAYVWGSTNRTDPYAHQFLATNLVDNDWIVPTAAGPIISISTTDSGTTAIAGAVNSVVGPVGTISTPVLSAAQIQTAVILTLPVPEPSSLALVTLTLPLRRRRR
jgi:hypothetical protein